MSGKPSLLVSETVPWPKSVRRWREPYPLPLLFLDVRLKGAGAELAPSPAMVAVLKALALDVLILMPLIGSSAQPRKCYTLETISASANSMGRRDRHSVFCRLNSRSRPPQKCSVAYRNSSTHEKK